MRKIISFLTISFTLSLGFASTHGGGVFSVGDKEILTKIQSAKIIYSAGEKLGKINVAYGNVDPANQWSIEKANISAASVDQNSSLFEALQKSEVTKSWVELR